MTVRLTLILVLMVLPGFSTHALAADRCQALIGTCAYYSCVDQERLSCGDKGYAIGYGRRYCEKFSALQFTPSFPGAESAVFPDSGNDWRDSVRTCLQEDMEAFFESDQPKDCSSLRAFAFGSHPRCYTEGPSFCALKPQSVIRIGLTIQGDLLTAESLQQVRDTAQICVAQLEERIDSESNAFVRWNLQQYQGIWRLVSIDPSRLPSLLKPYQLGE